MKYITLKKLRKLNACPDSIIRFRNKFGKNGKIHVKKLIEILHKNKDSNGYSRWLFEKFILTGICYNYYSGGNIFYKSYYENGKLNGERIVYYDNGKIALQENYKNSKLHGEYINYYENGKIAYKANFKDGLKQGERIRHYKNGKLI